MYRATLATIVSAIVLFLLGPVIVVVASAFTTTSYLVFPPQGVTLNWFERVLADDTWRNAFFTSLGLGASATVVAFAVGVPLAVWLYRRANPPAVMNMMLMSPVMIPTIIFALGLLAVVSYLELGATKPVVLILALGIYVTPFFVRILLPALQQLNPMLGEAAQNLGSPPLRTWLLVLLPATKTALTAGIALAFILAFDELTFPLFLAGPKLSTLPVEIYGQSSYNIDPSVSAVSAILILITTVLVLVFSGRVEQRLVHKE